MTDIPQWQCTVCSRVGTVGRCCGRDTRIPINQAAITEQQKDRDALAEIEARNNKREEL